VPLLSLVPDIVEPQSRGRVMSLAMIGTGIGAIAIQVAGKLFWERDFALVYYASALLLFVAAVPPLFWLREPKVGADESPPLQGRPLDALKGLPAILAFERPVALFLGSAALRYLGTGLVISYVTLFAVADLEIRVGDAALAIAVSGLLRLALALPAGRLVDVRDRRKLLLLATWCTAIVYLGTGVFVEALWQLYAVLALAAAAGVLEMAAGGPLFMDLMPEERRGEFTGVNLVLQNILRAAGALAGGALFVWTGSYRAVFPLAAICFALSALVLSRSPRELRSPSVVAAGLDRPLP
jgi:MFS family permease